MLRTLALFALTIGLAAAPSSAQGANAAVIYYGNACSNATGQAPAPAIVVAGTPTLLGTVRIRYQGPNGGSFNGRSIPILFTGLSPLNVTVPRLTANMSSTCTALVNPDIAALFMPLSTTGIAYVDTITYQIPNVPQLLGQSVYHQWATWTENCLGPCTLNYLMFSNAAQIYVGL